MQLAFDAADLRPIVEAVVAELADRLAGDDGRIAYSTAEVAHMLGVSPTIREERRQAWCRAEHQILGVPSPVVCRVRIVPCIVPPQTTSPWSLKSS